MARTLTKKQNQFVQEYLDTGNATEAASRAYKPQNRATARAIGSENLTKPNIRAYLDEKAHNAARMLYELSQTAENESVRLSASKDILDRTGYGDTPRITLDLDYKSRIDAEKQRVIDELFPDRDE
jgi:phage terminase small subunit